jgi:hypothetical protein
MTSGARLLITTALLLNCFFAIAQNGGAIKANWLGPNKPSPPPKPREEYLDPSLAGTGTSQGNAASTQVATENMAIFNTQKRASQSSYEVASNGISAIADLIRQSSANKHLKSIQATRNRALADMEQQISTGSYQVELCERCDGKGLLDHKPCNGEGKVNCSICSGRGTSFSGSACTYCQGSGKSYCLSGCSGTGVFDCRSCSATGMYLVKVQVVQPVETLAVKETEEAQSASPSMLTPGNAEAACKTLTEEYRTEAVYIRIRYIEKLNSLRDGYVCRNCMRSKKWFEAEKMNFQQHVKSTNSVVVKVTKRDFDELEKQYQAEMADWKRRVLEADKQCMGLRSSVREYFY